MKFRANLQVFRRGNKSNEEEAQVEASEPAASVEATPVENTES